MIPQSKNYSPDGDTLVIGGKLKIEEGATVEGLPVDPLEPATASTLGGVKVGTGLSVTSEGVLSVTNPLTAAAAQADSGAEELSELVTSFNALLAAMRTAGLLAASAE